MRIDLHTHSTASDGTDTPAELMAAARASGLDVIALTDHDTTAGWQAARDALPPGLRLLPGAELSCEINGSTVHLLAYLFDPNAPALVAEQTRLRAERRQRVTEMAYRLAADGHPIEPEELLASLPDTGSVGRPHLGRALVRAGVVDTVGEAFHRFLREDGPYYAPRRHTPARVAIEMIRAAGGVTVLAHGFSTTRGPGLTERSVLELVDAGLHGVEADHPEHDPSARHRLTELARERDLVITGSSDYHGTNKTIPLGAETTEPEMLERLIAAAHGAEVARR